MNLKTWLFELHNHLLILLYVNKFTFRNQLNFFYNIFKPIFLRKYMNSFDSKYFTKNIINQYFVIRIVFIFIFLNWVQIIFSKFLKSLLITTVNIFFIFSIVIIVKKEIFLFIFILISNAFFRISTSHCIIFSHFLVKPFLLKESLVWSMIWISLWTFSCL